MNAENKQKWKNIVAHGKFLFNEERNCLILKGVVIQKTSEECPNSKKCGEMPVNSK